VGHFVEGAGVKLMYADPLTGDQVDDDTVAVVLMAHNASITYFGTGVDIKVEGHYYKIGTGSIILDPWRTTPDLPGIKVVHYGNTRIEK
jgi:hypothetical protein